MYERFTDRAKKVMQVAQHEAQRLNHEAVATEHILLGLAREASGVAGNVLKKLDVDFRKIRAETEKLAPAKRAGSRSEEKLPLSAGAKQVVEGAQESARELGHNHVGTEHLLLALLKVTEGAAPRILANLGLKPEQVRDEVLRVLGHTPPPAEATPVAGTTPTISRVANLDVYAQDLTALASQKQLAPLLGRVEELEEILQVIGCLHRHRLLLIGDPGSGKRSLLRGLAQKMASDAVPEGFPRRLLRLDLGVVLAAFEGPPPAARLLMLLNEARAGGILLALEGLPLLFRSTTEGLGGLFRAWLTGGPSPVIASLSQEELRALERTDPEFVALFEQLVIRPPTADEALVVLKSQRTRLETHHKVKITDEAVSTALERTAAMAGGSLSNTALNLLDRAAARVRLKTASRPAGVKEMDAEITRLEREKENAVANQDFEKAAALRDQAEKLKVRREQVVREWEAIAGPSSDTVDAPIVQEVAAQLANR